MRQWRDGLETLPPLEKAEALTALMDYALDGKPYAGTNGAVKMFFAMITKQIDEHNAKYQEICEKRSRSASERWEKQKSANASKSIQVHTNASKSSHLYADNDSEYDSVGDSDSDNDINKKKDTPIRVSKEKAEQSSSPKFIFKKALIERGCNEQLAEDYIALRTRKKAPSTKTAFDGIVREAEKFIGARPGATFADVITIMVERNWVGFNAKWVKDEPAAESEESEYIKAMNAQIRRQRELDARIDAERQRRKREAEANNNNNK